MGIAEVAEICLFLQLWRQLFSQLMKPSLLKLNLVGINFKGLVASFAWGNLEVTSRDLNHHGKPRWLE